MSKSKQSGTHHMKHGEIQTSQMKKELERKHGGILGILRTTKATTSAGNNIESYSRKQLELPKLLLNVTVQNSLGTLQVVMKPNDTVKDLITAAIGVYVKEKRRPFLGCDNSMCFELHYSQFSLECLSWEEKLMNLGSRNFFLCQKLNGSSTTSTFCCKESSKGGTVQLLFPFTKFMDFLL